MEKPQMSRNIHALNSPVMFEDARATVSYTIHRYGRFWQVLDPIGELVCITVYKRGAKEVVRRLCEGRSYA